LNSVPTCSASSLLFAQSRVIYYYILLNIYGSPTSGDSLHIAGEIAYYQQELNSKFGRSNLQWSHARGPMRRQRKTGQRNKTH